MFLLKFSQWFQMIFQDKINILQCFAKFCYNPDPNFMNSYHSGFQIDIICHILLGPVPFLKPIFSLKFIPQNSVFLLHFLTSTPIWPTKYIQRQQNLNILHCNNLGILQNVDTVFLILIHPFLRYKLYFLKRKKQLLSTKTSNV